MGRMKEIQIGLSEEVPEKDERPQTQADIDREDALIRRDGIGISKHTPGPWRFEADVVNRFCPRTGEPTENRTTWIYGAEAYAHVALLSTSKPAQVTSADAALIAASPELLLACQWALSALLLGPNADKKQAIDYLYEVIGKAQALPGIGK